MRCLTLVIALFTLGGTTALDAQAPAARPAGPPPSGPGEVRGVLVEAETNAPVPQAAVALRGQDGVVVAGAIANDKGMFQMIGLRPGTYTMRITRIGFAPKVQPVAITPSAPAVALGTIAMSRIAVQLDAVTTVEDRDAMAIEPDRNAYRARDVAPAAQNASDVLENVPAVQVDGDGRVSLRGNENVVVQINGRPTPIRGQQLASYLKSLPANVVDRVEVIPNPSAKYDPEGMAGIINILLKQQVDLGLSGGATVSAANADRYSGSGNIGYQAGAWTTFLNVGHNADERNILGVNDRERFSGGNRVAATDQDLSGRNGFGGTNVNGNVEYKLNARDALLSTFAFGRRRFADNSNATYNEFDGAGTLIEMYDRSRDTRTSGSMYDGSVGFRRTWDAKQKHELLSELRYTLNDDTEHTTLWRVNPAGSASALVEGELDDTDSQQRQLVAQADYTRTFTNRRKLEAGYKGTSRWLDRDFRVRKDALGTGDWAASPLSNAFRFNDQVQAAYGVYSHGVGKFDLQGGLRAEYASRDFVLGAQSYPHDYVSLFPSASAAYAPSEALSYRASYSRRIRRPGTQELNPFPTFFDAQNVFFGNPALDPEYTDSYDFSITRNGRLGSLQLSPYYRNTTDDIEVNINTDDVVDGRPVTSVSFRNMATSTSWGSDLNGNLRLGQKLNAFGGFNIFRMVTDGGSLSSLTANGVSWMGRMNVSSQVTSGTTLQGSYFYRAPMPVPGGKFASMQMSNFSVRQKVRGESSTVTLRVVDPFNTQRMKIRAGDDNLTQLTSRHFGVRAIFLSYQYTFGRPPRIRQRQEEQQQQQGGGFGP